jgi:hypothetical protein
MYFVTLCDKDQIHKTINLKKSLGGNLIVIDTYDKSIGNFSKLFKFADFLKNDSSYIDMSDVICFIDAFDMLCIKYDPGAIERKFKSMQKDVIFGAEENCGPEHTGEVKKYFENNGNLYLNGGFQIGYKKSFLELHEYVHSNFKSLKDALEIDRTTEQGILSQVYIKHLFNMGLDSESKLVNNWGPRRDLRDLDSHFIHVVRGDTDAENFVMTPELQLHFIEYIRGQVRYDKHIDMIMGREAFILQSKRYRELLQKYSATFSQIDTHMSNAAD